MLRKIELVVLLSMFPSLLLALDFATPLPSGNGTEDQGEPQLKRKILSSSLQSPTLASKPNILSSSHKDQNPGGHDWGSKHIQKTKVPSTPEESTSLTDPTQHSTIKPPSSSIPTVIMTTMTIVSATPVPDDGRPLPMVSSQTITSSTFSSLRSQGPDATPPAISGGESVPPRHTSSPAAIIGGVIGGLVFLALLVGLGLLYYRRHRSRIAPSAAHRAANDREDWLRVYSAMDDPYRQTEQFRPDMKQNVANYTTPGNVRETDVAVESALRRKAEVLDDLKFEAAARDGVKVW